MKVARGANDSMCESSLACSHGDSASRSLFAEKLKFDLTGRSGQAPPKSLCSPIHPSATCRGAGSRAALGEKSIREMWAVCSKERPLSVLSLAEILYEKIRQLETLG